jgi:hypothetical protein
MNGAKNYLFFAIAPFSTRRRAKGQFPGSYRFSQSTSMRTTVKHRIAPLPGTLRPPPASTPTRQTSATVGYDRIARFLCWVRKACCVGLCVVGLGSPSLCSAGTDYWVLVDHHTRPLPGEAPCLWYYNDVGGDRGLIYDVTSGQFSISKPAETSYKIRVDGLLGASQWTSSGGWYALGRCKSNLPRLSPSALLHPMIMPRYQSKLTGVEVLVSGLESPSGRSDLSLRVELKGFGSSGQEILRWQNTWSGRAALLSTNYPASFFAELNPTNLSEIGMVLWILDRATTGDSIEVDAVRLRVESPNLPTEVEALLWSLSHLLYNYDEDSGMVGDRSNFPDRVDENITATAKLAKLLALGIELNVLDETRARAAVVKMADTLLVRVPRGPAGTNTLWPHFTRNGGTEKLPEVEWSSGDTAYAALDLMLALKLIGDPSNQLAQAETFLRSIDWEALRATNGGFYHGYASDGTLLPGIWHGFGAETLGVLLAAQVGGVTGEMGPPPTDNGSGFILHAAYPIPLTGVDRWTNNWYELRANEVQAQLNWYFDPSHTNSYLAQRGWFGLSAAEPPRDCGGYEAYGIGGSVTAPNDGDHSVAVLHYSGMIAWLEPEPAKRMWESMRSFGLLSPMNNVESISVWPSTGATTNHSLRGSWNLALQTEGWMLSMPGGSAVLYDAFRSITNLADAYDVFFPPQPVPPDLAVFPLGKCGVEIRSQTQLPNENLNGVVFGNAGFVAVGIGGRVLHSKDGRAWVPEYSGLTNNLNAVAFGDGQYVAVGNQGSILRSSDSFLWVLSASGTTNHLNSVVHGSDKWLAVGDHGTALISADAVTWTSNYTGVSGQLLDASFGAGRFIVAGGVLLSSSNALDWTTFVATNSLDRFMCASYGDGTFVALAYRVDPHYTSVIRFTSADGLDWIEHAGWLSEGWHLGRSWPWPRLKYVGGLFSLLNGGWVYVGNETYATQPLQTSWDGFAWDQIEFLLNGMVLVDSAFGNGNFVAVGEKSLLRGVILPEFTWVDVSDGVFSAGLRGEPSVVYEIQASTNLASWAAVTNASAAGGRVVLSEPVVQGTAQRFYRAIRR